jgi:hypothetical protein
MGLQLAWGYKRVGVQGENRPGCFVEQGHCKNHNSEMQLEHHRNLTLEELVEGLEHNLALVELVEELVEHNLVLELNMKILQVFQDRAIQLQKYYFPWESTWANLLGMGS